MHTANNVEQISLQRGKRKKEVKTVHIGQALPNIPKSYHKTYDDILAGKECTLQDNAFKKEYPMLAGLTRCQTKGLAAGCALPFPTTAGTEFFALAFSAVETAMDRSSTGRRRLPGQMEAPLIRFL